MFKGQVYHALAGTKQKGVLIYIQPHVQWEVKKGLRDKEGRYIIINAILDKEGITSVNIYAPNRKQKEFYQRLIKN